MSNLYEDPNANKQEVNEKQEWDFESIKSFLERRIDVKIPDDMEELFRNFDKYVPQDFRKFRGGQTVSDPLFLVNKEAIKNALERNLYGGATMEEVNTFFETELEKSIKALDDEQIAVDAGYQQKYDEKKVKKYDKILDSFNGLNGSNLGIPLADLELRIYQNLDVDDQESARLRKLAERLSAELYKDRSKNKIELDEVKKTLQDFEKRHNSWVEASKGKASTSKEYLDELYGKVFAGFDRGDYGAALREVEFEIGNIQQLLDGRKDKEFRHIEEGILKERYGEDFMPAVNGDLTKLRSYRKFLKSEMSKKEKQSSEKNKKEATQNETSEKKETLEGEKLFQAQIENNANPLAKDLQENLILFIKSFDKGIATAEDFESIKDELSQVLYRSGVEYSENAKIEIAEENKEILQPILDFRSELDQWNTTSQERQADFRSRIMSYLKNVFGIETYRPGDGEALDSKKARAVKIVETPNFLLDMKIKAVLSPGYKINDKFFDYYQKWFGEKTKEINDKRTAFKGMASGKEFDKQYLEGEKWIRKYRLIKLIEYAKVEVFKHKK